MDNLQVRHLRHFIFIGLLLGIIPYLIAWSLTPADMIFSGNLINPDDYSAYLSAMVQGRSGYWLYRYFFTPENYQPQFMYILYILLGKLAGIFNCKNNLFLLASRIAFGLFSFRLFLFWVQSLFKSRAVQTTAWILISFGSGFGFFILLLAGSQAQLPPDLSTPEWNTITQLISSPHFILTSGLLAVYYGSLIYFEQEPKSWKWTIRAMLAGTGVGLIYPYHIPSIGLTTGVWLGLDAISKKKIPWNKWGRGVVILSPLTILLFYYTFFTRRDPLWEKSFISEHLIAPPSPRNLFMGFGLLWIFVIAIILIENKKLISSKLLLPTIWILINCFLLYLPIPFAGRFLLGFQIPIATLAAAFLEKYLLPTMQRPKILRKTILWMTILTTLLFVALVSKTAKDHQTYPFYFFRADITAANWLATKTTEEDIVFANYPIGSYLPSVTNTKVFVGQLFITIDLEEKLTDTEKFWNPQTPQSWRHKFVEKWGITYVFQGSYENPPEGEFIHLPWNIIYQVDGVTIYAIDSEISTQ